MKNILLLKKLTLFWKDILQKYLKKETWEYFQLRKKIFTWRKVRNEEFGKPILH